jgi:hypothetical protein
MKPPKTKSIAEFGDFQTPVPLALEIGQLLARRLDLRPLTILEPSCGRGAFVSAALESFPDAERVVGADLNPDHLAHARASTVRHGSRVQLLRADFFRFDWAGLVAGTRGPWLILGNPPWVTSAELGAMSSNNLPDKSNFQERTGIEAITGKSNFDISEWMLLRYLDWLKGHIGAIAVLCKTAVARKILLHCWKRQVPVQSACIFKIDAESHFGASVEACLFVLSLGGEASSSRCDVFDSLEAAEPSGTIGFAGGHLVNDVRLLSRHEMLLGQEPHYIWRSGVKHDCSRVMELTLVSDESYRSGVEEEVTLEPTYLYPLLKSSDVGNGRSERRAVMLVTQQFVGEETAGIRSAAPLTWQYLQRHSALLDKRASVIYKNKPSFSIFGVGPYTFAPWKVAISGFYKKLAFLKVGPVNGRPVVFDDTVNFLPCYSEEEASFVEALLSSTPAQELLSSMIHWDEKRPITVDVLKRLNLRELAKKLGRQEDYARFTTARDVKLVRLAAGAR